MEDTKETPELEYDKNDYPSIVEAAKVHLAKHLIHVKRLGDQQYAVYSLWSKSSMDWKFEFKAYLEATQQIGDASDQWFCERCKELNDAFYNVVYKKEA